MGNSPHQVEHITYYGLIPLHASNTKQISNVYSIRIYQLTLNLPHYMHFSQRKLRGHESTSKVGLPYIILNNCQSNSKGDSHAQQSKSLELHIPTK